jgi:ATP-dependent RNA helicase DDX19/DBP5
MITFIFNFVLGLSRVLIATNVLARGIDIPQVSLVVNFDMPFTASGLPDPETYLHRIGRTGRFGRPGVSINFISDERARSCQEHIKTFFNRPINEIATHDLETLDKQLNATS